MPNKAVEDHQSEPSHRQWGFISISVLLWGFTFGLIFAIGGWKGLVGPFLLPIGFGSIIAIIMLQWRLRGSRCAIVFQGSAYATALAAVYTDSFVLGHFDRRVSNPSATFCFSGSIMCFGALVLSTAFAIVLFAVTKRRAERSSTAVLLVATMFGSLCVLPPFVIRDHRGSIDNFMAMLIACTGGLCVSRLFPGRTETTHLGKDVAR
jgi:hypothetical protein